MHMVGLKVHRLLVSRAFLLYYTMMKAQVRQAGLKTTEVGFSGRFSKALWPSLSILILYSCSLIAMTKVLHQNQTMEVQGCSKFYIWQKSGGH